MIDVKKIKSWFGTIIIKFGMCKFRFWRISCQKWCLLCLLENEEHDSKVVRKIHIGIFNVETFYVGRGKKPRAQTSRIFHYFLKMVTMDVLCYKGEKEKEEVGKELPPSVKKCLLYLSPFHWVLYHFSNG